MKVIFFLPQTAQFDKSINPFCLVFLTFKFLFAVCLLQLTQYVSIITYNQQLFLTAHFIALILLYYLI